MDRREELCLEVAELNKRIKEEKNEKKKEQLIKKRDKLKDYLLYSQFDYDISDLCDSLYMKRDYLDREDAIERIDRDYNGR